MNEDEKKELYDALDAHDNLTVGELLLLVAPFIVFGVAMLIYAAVKYFGG